VLEYLDSFQKTVKEGAECPDAVVQLERRFVLAEVGGEFATQLFHVGHVVLKFSQLLSRRLCTSHVSSAIPFGLYSRPAHLSYRYIY